MPSSEPLIRMSKLARSAGGRYVVWGSSDEVTALIRSDAASNGPGWRHRARRAAKVFARSPRALASRPSGVGGIDETGVAGASSPSLSSSPAALPLSALPLPALPVPAPGLTAGLPVALGALPALPA